MFEVPLYYLGSAVNDGTYASAGLATGPDNALYGTAPSGGIDNVGAIFKIGRDGTGYAVIHQFTNNPDGAGAVSALRYCSDGLLYGTTPNGGTNNEGVVFRISLNGSLYQILCEFNSSAGSAQHPEGQLIQGVDGALYGTTSAGGGGGAGTVFKINLDGSGYQVLYNFSNTPDGATSEKGVIQGSDGLLYGTTFYGGLFNNGTVFRLSTNGDGYQILHSFTNSPDGSNPQRLLLANNGILYGTTSGGGAKSVGTVYQINPNGSGYQILRSFTNSAPDAFFPLAGLAQGFDGALYGTSYSGGANNQGAIYRIYPAGTNYEVVYSFSNNYPTHPDGAHPTDELLPAASTDNSGVLYGTTTEGNSFAIGSGGSVFGFVTNPGLTITPLNNQTVVMWPAWALNYLLQTTTNLTSGNWTTMTNGIPLTGLQLTNTVVQPNSYFRLIWPN